MNALFEKGFLTESIATTEQDDKTEKAWSDFPDGQDDHVLQSWHMT